MQKISCRTRFLLAFACSERKPRSARDQKGLSSAIAQVYPSRTVGRLPINTPASKHRVLGRSCKKDSCNQSAHEPLQPLHLAACTHVGRSSLSSYLQIRNTNQAPMKNSLHPMARPRHNGQDQGAKGQTSQVPSGNTLSSLALLQGQPSDQKTAFVNAGQNTNVEAFRHSDPPQKKKKPRRHDESSQIPNTHVFFGGARPGRAFSSCLAKNQAPAAPAMRPRGPS